MPAFKACLSDVLNTPPTEDEQKELKLSDRNHSPSSVSMFEAIGTLILISDILDSKKSNLLKVRLLPVGFFLCGHILTLF